MGQCVYYSWNVRTSNFGGLMEVSQRRKSLPYGIKFDCTSRQVPSTCLILQTASLQVEQHPVKDAQTLVKII
jgi:hypothetical protein